jgi:hypothetical protein
VRGGLDVGFIDKLKEAAQEGVEVAKKGAAAAKDKVEDVQLRRKADDLAKQVGYLVVKGEGSGEEATRLVSEIKDLEAQLAAQAENAETGDDAAAS